MFFMAKRLYILVLLFATVSVAFAQFTTTYNIDVQRKFQNRETGEIKTAPAPQGTVVYFFNTLAQANEAIAILNAEGAGNNGFSGKDKDIVLPKNKYAEVLKVKNGRATGKIGTHSYCIANNYDMMWTSSPHAIGGETDFTVEIIDYVQKNIDITKSTIRLDEVTKTEKRKYTVNKSTVFRRPHAITADINYPISKEAANSKQRYVLMPIVYVMTDTSAFTSEALAHAKMDSVFLHMPPITKDGVDYSKTMLRRMAYDSSHDRLDKYVDKSDLVKTREKDYFFRYSALIENVNDNYRYPILAHRWYENYSSIVLNDTLMVNDGFSPNPLRFLDFRLNDVDIDEERYWQEPKGDIQELKESLDLNFEKGKSVLNDNDSVGFAQIDKIRKRMQGIIDNDGNVYGATVVGQASPEGGYETNDRLSSARAAYVANIIGRFTRSTSKHSVAKWSDVADLMMKDSIDHPEYREMAQEIYSVASTTSDMRSQEAKLRQAPYWNIIESEFLPKLRKTDVYIEYKERHTWTREEVANKYKEDKSWMPSEPYQFCYLFQILKSDPQAIKRYAREAMKITSANTASGDPWPMAAYYYAKALTNEGKCDTTILKPYIVKNVATGINHQIAHGDNRGDWVNDEAIVMQQIRMMSNYGLYEKASELLNTVFARSAQIDTLQAMLQCMTDPSNISDANKKMVSETSPWNYVILLSAEGMDKALAGDNSVAQWYTAYNMLLNDSIFNHDSGREYYQLAVLAKRLCGGNTNKITGRVPYPESVFELEEDMDHKVNMSDSEDDRPQDYGGWMVKACEMDPSLLNVLRLDGEFNQNYRDGFAAYWNSLDPSKHRRLK